MSRIGHIRTDQRMSLVLLSPFRRAPSGGLPGGGSGWEQVLSRRSLSSQRTPLALCRRCDTPSLPRGGGTAKLYVLTPYVAHKQHTHGTPPHFGSKPSTSHVKLKHNSKRKSFLRHHVRESTSPGPDCHRPGRGRRAALSQWRRPPLSTATPRRNGGVLPRNGRASQLRPLVRPTC